MSDASITPGKFYADRLVVVALTSQASDAIRVMRANGFGDVGRYIARLADELGRIWSEQERWLSWSGGRYPDDSPGDVVAAYADGTVVLDDGITTWNPLRACEFLSDTTVTTARDVVRAWERLGRCEDEFGPCSEFCGEHAENLDSAVVSLKAALAACPVSAGAGQAIDHSGPGLDGEPLRCRHGYLIEGDDLARKCYEDGVPRIVPSAAGAGQHDAAEHLGGAVTDHDLIREARAWLADTFEAAVARANQLKEALTDFSQLLPPDRWYLLRRETLQTLGEVQLRAGVPADPVPDPERAAEVIGQLLDRDARAEPEEKPE